jgi:hypothetical protein
MNTRIDQRRPRANGGVPPLSLYQPAPAAGSIGLVIEQPAVVRSVPGKETPILSSGATAAIAVLPSGSVSAGVQGQHNGRTMAPILLGTDVRSMNRRFIKMQAQKRAVPSSYSAASNVFRAGDVKLCSEQSARPVSPRPNRSPQTAGSKNSVSAVDVMSPPITTVASGR